MTNSNQKSIQFLATEFLKDVYQRFQIQTPSTHIVLGSGFAAAMKSAVNPQEWSLRGTVAFSEMPGLPATTVVGHSSEFHFYENIKTRRSVIVQLGRIHGYEGHSPQQVVHPVMASFFAGTTQFILTNAAGSLTSRFSLGSMMFIEDQFNFTGKNPLTGPNPVGPTGQVYGPRFPDMTEIYQKELRAKMKSHFQSMNLPVVEGVYLGLSGPSYETPVEVSIFGKWGAHAVGMSTVWEAIALKHAGAKIAGISLISNLACGLGEGTPLNHEDILTQCAQSASQILKGIFSFLNTEFSNEKV